MKKAVGRTILCTILIIVIALAVVYGCLAWFTPKTLGKVYDSIGWYDGYTRYYEQSYNKTQSYEDLYSDLVVRLDAKEDSFRTKNYITIFIYSPEFEEFCITEDAKNANDKISTYDFVVGKLCAAVEFYAGPWQCAEYCKQYVIENGEYGEYNPFNYVLTNYKDDIAESQKVEIKKAITSLLPLLSESEKVFAQRDLGL